MRHLAFIALAFVAAPFVRAAYWCQEKLAAAMARVRAWHASAKDRATKGKDWIATKAAQAKALLGIG